MLDEREKYYIKQYDSFYNGYNMTDGGSNPKNFKNHMLSEYDIEHIIYLLKNTRISMTEIGEMYGVSCTMITYINNGYQYILEDIQYPIRSIEENSQISKEYSIKKNSGNNSYKHIIEEKDLPIIIYLLRNTVIPQTQIAEYYGVSCYAIRDINRGKSWKQFKREVPLRPNYGAKYAKYKINLEEVIENLKL